MKKSFVLFITLILIFLFSTLSLRIFESKSINSINILNQYNYIQAKNHLNFLENLVLQLDDLENITNLEIEDEKYKIKALIKKVETLYEIELTVENISSNIRLTKSIKKIL